jgi:hypothetical protein
MLCGYSVSFFITGIIIPFSQISSPLQTVEILLSKRRLS